MDVCEKSAKATIIESISFRFTYSGCSLSDEAFSDLVDALQSPHCRLTDFKVDGESGCGVMRRGVFGKGSAICARLCTCGCVGVKQSRRAYSRRDMVATPRSGVLSIEISALVSL